MNWKFLAMTVALFVLCAFAPANAQTEKPKTQPVAPKGWVLVEEDDLIFFDGEPDYHFEEAKRHYMKGEKKETADEIRKAAAFMKLQESRATNSGKKSLAASIAELQKLADDIDKGAAVSEKDIDLAFARAHNALTKHYVSKAKEEYKEDSGMAGHDLKAATTNLELAVKWSGKKTEEGWDAVIDGARTISGKMMEGTGWTADKVSEAAGKVASESDKLGKKLESGKK